MEIRNAKITSTMLGYEDHGIMVAYVHLDGGGWGVGFGGLCLDEPIKDKDGNFIRREGTAYGLEFIKRVLDVVGVDKWEQLPNKYVRVEKGNCGSTIEKIGHIVKDKWFNIHDIDYLVNSKKGVIK